MDTNCKPLMSEMFGFQHGRFCEYFRSLIFLTSVFSCIILWYISCIIYIQGVPGGKVLTSGECSLGQTIPI